MINAGFGHVVYGAFDWQKNRCLVIGDERKLLVNSPSASIDEIQLSVFRSPMGLPQVAGISRWPHFRVPRDTRGFIRDSVT